MSDTVSLKLAHPLTADQAAKVRAKTVKDYGAGDTIAVLREDAQAIISAGFAQVDPADADAVAKALKVDVTTAQAEVSTRGSAPAKS